MRLERIEASGFRNLSGVALDLSPGLNHLAGSNGAGKTAILEAVHLLFRGRSFRTARFESVLRVGSDEAIVRAELDASGLRHAAAAGRSSGARGRWRLDGVDCRVADVACLLPIQLMLPDASDLVYGGPATRRSFLDWGTFHVKREHLDDVRGYQRALRQRNAVLKSARGDETRLPAEFDIWTAALIEHAQRVDRQRREYVDALRPEVSAVLERLAPELDVSLSYDAGWSDGTTFEETLVVGRPRDVKSGATQSGPHRADVRLAVPQGKAAEVLSRGQAKMLASGLHLAQARGTRMRTGAESLFLIDDVGAELDEAHRQTFFHLLDDEGSQVITTGTGALAVEHGYRAGIRTFHVEHGECRPKDH